MRHSWGRRLPVAREAGAHTPISPRMPAIQALVIQGVSLLIIFILFHTILAPAGVQMTLVAATLLQGAIAAAISRRRGLAPWWQLIQFLFPGALMATHALQLPPGIFLAAFVLLLGLYWTTFQTQVPLYPSGPEVWEKVVALLPRQPVRFIDMGSGLGGLVLDLAGRRPESSFTGIEVAPLPWIISWLRAWVTRSRSRFIRGDYSRLNFADYDVVFAYLSPIAMPALWEKANREMRPGALLLSYEFPVPDTIPDIVCAAPGGPNLYGWRM